MKCLGRTGTEDTKPAPVVQSQQNASQTFSQNRNYNANANSVLFLLRIPVGPDHHFTCYHCGQPGHMKRDCPSLPTNCHQERPLLFHSQIQIQWDRNRDDHCQLSSVSNVENLDIMLTAACLNVLHQYHHSRLLEHLAVQPMFLLWPKLTF